MKKSIVVIDANGWMLDQISRILNGELDIQCTGTYRSIGDAIWHIRDEGPDVVLLEIKSRGEYDLESLRALRSYVPSATIIVTIIYEDCWRIIQAIESGANGFWTKSSGPKPLLDVIRTDRGTGVQISPWMARRMAKHFDQSGLNPAEPGVWASPNARI